MYMYFQVSQSGGGSPSTHSYACKVHAAWRDGIEAPAQCRVRRVAGNRQRDRRGALVLDGAAEELLPPRLGAFSGGNVGWAWRAAAAGQWVAGVPMQGDDWGPPEAHVGSSGRDLWMDQIATPRTARDLPGLQLRCTVARKQPQSPSSSKGATRPEPPAVKRAEMQPDVYDLAAQQVSSIRSLERSAVEQLPMTDSATAQVLPAADFRVEQRLPKEDDDVQQPDPKGDGVHVTAPNSPKDCPIGASGRVQTKPKIKTHAKSKTANGCSATRSPMRTSRVHSPVRIRTEARMADAMAIIQLQFRAASYTAAGMDFSRLFRHYDRDHSGQIGFDEFSRAVRCDAKLTRAQVDDKLLRAIFENVDADASGTIGLLEFEGLVSGAPYVTCDSADSPRWLGFNDTRASRTFQLPHKRLGDEYMKTHGKKTTTRNSKRSQRTRAPSPSASPSAKARGTTTPRQRATGLSEGRSPTQVDRVVVVEPWSETDGKKTAKARRKKGQRAMQHARAQGAAALARSSPGRTRSRSPLRQRLAQRRGKLGRKATVETDDSRPEDSMPRTIYMAELEEALALLASEQTSTHFGASAATVTGSHGNSPYRALSPGERISASMFEARWQDKLQKLASDLDTATRVTEDQSDSGGTENIQFTHMAALCRVKQDVGAVTQPRRDAELAESEPINNGREPNVATAALHQPIRTPQLHPAPATTTADTVGGRHAGRLVGAPPRTAPPKPESAKHILTQQNTGPLDAAYVGSEDSGAL